MENYAAGSSVNDELTSGEARAQRAARALIFALVLALGLATVVGAGIGENVDQVANATEDAPRLGGDYPAFFGAGSIILDGDLESLYVEDRQIDAQVGLLSAGGYLAFAYPPHVAAVYAPLAALPFQPSYLIHTLIMAASYFATLRVLAPIVPIISRWRLPLLAAGFTFYPLAIAIGGGQNAALTVLGFAIIWRALHEDREWVAGFVAGLMMYRPQYALAAIGLMLLSKHWRAVGTAAATTVVTWAGTAVFFGLNWLPEWLEAVVPFVERDAEVNADNSISALGFFQALLGVESTLALVVGLAIAGSVVVTLMFLWSQPERFALSHRMAALAIGSVIISPHANFYDAAVLVIAGAAILGNKDRTNAPIKLLVIGWLAFLPYPVLRDLPANHLAGVMAVAFIAMVIATLQTEDRDIDPIGVARVTGDQKVTTHA